MHDGVNLVSDITMPVLGVQTKCFLDVLGIDHQQMGPETANSHSLESRCGRDKGYTQYAPRLHFSMTASGALGK